MLLCEGQPRRLRAQAAGPAQAEWRLLSQRRRQGQCGRPGSCRPSRGRGRAAAGGIGDARGVVAVLALGAQAAVLGTRLLASTESRAHPHYKQRLLEANEGDTVRTTLFGQGCPNAPHGAMQTVFMRHRLGQEARGQEAHPDESVVGQTVSGGQVMPVRRFVSLPPNCDAVGDMDALSLLAGQGVGLVREDKPAGQIVQELVEEARQIISQRLLGLAATAAGRGKSKPASERGGGCPPTAELQAALVRSGLSASMPTTSPSWRRPAQVKAGCLLIRLRHRE